jgi:hypothetical protein
VERRYVPDDPDQSKRFIEAARIAEANEYPKAFDRAFASLNIKTKSLKSPKQTKSHL